MALSGEEALNRINFNSSQASHVYDIIIAEEHLYQHPHTLEEEKKDKGGNNPNNDHLHQYQTSDLLGSELLQLVTEIEATFLSNGNNSNARVPNPSQHKIEGKEESSIESQSSRRARKSLKIGVSVSLGEDCESLRKGGADIFWSKPPPKPSNGLRNQVLNTLINKRGKTFFICGC